MTKRITHIMLILACLIFTTSIWTPSSLADVVKLKNGKTYDCEVLREMDDYIEIRITFGSIVENHVIFMDDIESITYDKAETGESESETDATDGRGNITIRDVTDPTGTTDATPGKFDPNSSDLHNKKVFVIPLHEMVGQYFRQDKLEEAIDAARPYDPDVIILEISSGGGLLLEIYRLRDYLVEVRDEFRIVVWIKSAISAAAMTAFNCREMYFMKEGHIGAATAFAGGTALQGEELEEWINCARDMFVSAGYSPLIAQAMIDEAFWLSVDREELPNGDVRITWHDDDSGEDILSRPEENLVLTASQAEKYRVSLGTVDDTEEFARMLNLEGWVEVSDEGREIMEKWWAVNKEADKRIPILKARYGLYGDGSRASIGQQIRIVKELISWCDRLGPEVVGIFFQLDKDRLELDLKKLIRQLKN